MKWARTSGWIVDAVGALLVVSALVVATWLGVIQSVEARSVAKETRERIATSHEMLAALSSQRSDQQRLLEDNERILSELGGRSEPWTGEEYLQKVAALSKKYDMRVVQHKQLGERRYPGLREQLYSFQVEGTTQNLWLLLRAIEEIHAWADVSYLKLDSGRGVANRMAAITISMFAEQDANGSSEKSGGSHD